MSTKTKKRGGLSAHEIKRMVEIGQLIPNPDFKPDEQMADDFLRNPLNTLKDYESNFPERFGKMLPKDGSWIRVQDPPHCEYTVPPFSIWFAVPWPMSGSEPKPKRVKISTPAGELGIFPHEYCLVEDITQWFGREPEGVFLRQMNANPVVDVDQLFYLMSRGITRQSATMLLIEQIKDPTFLWIEVAPQYGEYFGKEWPAHARCPFATARSEFVEIPLHAESPK